MQLQNYFLQVNDQQFDQVISVDGYATVRFINQHIQAAQDNKLIFYRTIKWLGEDNKTVLKEDKDVIMETVIREKIAVFHELIYKIEEQKETIANFQRAIFDVDKYIAEAGKLG
jgi:hypothetical protein